MKKFTAIFTLALVLTALSMGNTALAESTSSNSKKNPKEEGKSNLRGKPKQPRDTEKKSSVPGERRGGKDIGGEKVCPDKKCQKTGKKDHISFPKKVRGEGVSNNRRFGPDGGEKGAPLQKEKLGEVKEKARKKLLAQRTVPEAPIRTGPPDEMEVPEEYEERGEQFRRKSYRRGKERVRYRKKRVRRRRSWRKRVRRKRIKRRGTSWGVGVGLSSLVIDRIFTSSPSNRIPLGGLVIEGRYGFYSRDVVLSAALSFQAVFPDEYTGFVKIDKMFLFSLKFLAGYKFSNFLLFDNGIGLQVIATSRENPSAEGFGLSFPLISRLTVVLPSFPLGVSLEASIAFALPGFKRYYALYGINLSVVYTEF